MGRAHLYLAQAYFGLDNPVWAGEQLDLAMKAFTADGGNHAADTAMLMNIAAGIILKAGKLKEALQFLQAAAMYYGQAGDNTNAIASHLRMINVLLALGLYTAAQEEAEKAISVARTAPDQVGNLTAALAALGNCKFAFGEFTQAKKIYMQVLALMKKIPNEDISTLSKANLYLGYGTTLAALREYSQAQQALEFALPVFKAAGVSLSQAQTANTLGIIEWQLGHHEKAKELLEQALDLQNLISPKQDFFRNSILQSLGIIESRLGDNRQARAHLDAAATQQRKDKNTTGLARTELALAEISVKLAEQPETERLLNESIQLSQSVGDDSALWRAYTLLALMQLNKGDAKAAHESLLSATSFLRSPQAGDFYTPEHFYYPSDRKEMVYQLMRLLIQEKLVDEAFFVSEQLKQEAFLADWSNCNIQLTGADAELYTDLATQRVHLHSAEMLSPPNKVTKEWQNWIARFHTLAGQNNQLARLIAPLPATVAEVTRAVQTSHSVIFDYVLGTDSSILFTLGPSGKIYATILNTNSKQIAGEINSLLNAFARDNNATDIEQSNRLLRSLYSQLFPESVRSLLPQNQDDFVVIIPDGALDCVPFAALLNNKNEPLVASHTLSLASSLSTLIKSPPRYTDNASFLFVAGNSKGSEPADNMKQLKSIAEGLPSNSVTFIKSAEADLKNIQESVAGQATVQLTGNVDFADNGLNTPLPLKVRKDARTATVADLFNTSLSCDSLVINGSQVDKIYNQTTNNLMDPVALTGMRFTLCRCSQWHC